MLLGRSPSPLHLATPTPECDRFPFSSLYSYYYYYCHCSHLHLPRPPAFLPNCTSSSSFSSSSSCPFLSVRPRHPPRPPALPLACRPYCASLAPILHPGWQIDCASIAIIIAHRHRNHTHHHPHRLPVPFSFASSDCPHSRHHFRTLSTDSSPSTPPLRRSPDACWFHPPALWYWNPPATCPLSAFAPAAPPCSLYPSPASSSSSPPPFAIETAPSSPAPPAFAASACFSSIPPSPGSPVPCPVASIPTNATASAYHWCGILRVLSPTCHALPLRGRSLRSLHPPPHTHSHSLPLIIIIFIIVIIIIIIIIIIIAIYLIMVCFAFFPRVADRQACSYRVGIADTDVPGDIPSVFPSSWAASLIFIRTPSPRRTEYLL